MNLTVKLPCKPVVWKYLQNKYGPDMQLPADDWLKLLLYSLLQRNTGSDDADVTLQYYSMEVGISIPFRVYELYGSELSKTSIRVINNRVEDLIHQRLFIFLEFYVHVANYSLKDAILMFQELNALPEEYYSSDAIKKYYQRKIQPYLNPQKFASVNVPFKQKKTYTHRLTVETPDPRGFQTPVIAK